MNNVAVSWMPYTTVFTFSMILVALIIEVIVISRMFWSPDDAPVGIRQAIRYSEMLENAMVALMVGLGGTIVFWAVHSAFEFSLWHMYGLMLLVVVICLYYHLQKKLNSIICSHRTSLSPEDELKFFRINVFEDIIFCESEETKKALMDKYKLDDAQIGDFIHDNKETCKYALVSKAVCIILMIAFLIPTFVNKSVYGLLSSAVVFLAYVQSARAYKEKKKYMEIGPSEL